MKAGPITLSEMSQIQEDKNGMFSLICGIHIYIYIYMLSLFMS